MPPSKKQKQISAALRKFYDNPVSRVSLELFLTVGTIVFFAVAAIRPTLLTMSDLIKEIEDKKELNQKLIQKIAALSTAQNQYHTIEERARVLDEAIPTNPDLINILKITEKVASDQGLVITSLRVNEVPKKMETIPAFNNLQRQNISFQVNVMGSYPAIKMFVEELHASRRVVAVDTIVFNVEDNRGEKKLRANITVNAPYFGK